MILVTGGARSGKSSFAESLASEAAGQVTYIATAAAGDSEMRDRIQEHRARRPEQWLTVEAAEKLPAAIGFALGDGGTALVDCLTLYISNMLASQIGRSDRAEAMLHDELDLIIDMCASAKGGRLIVVSNEIGMGVVPDNALARSFRDIAGRANQKMAAAAEAVYLCVSGIPVRVK